MVDSQPITCVLCAEEATPKVVKDSGYNAMMVLLWEAIQIDVKFTENIKFELCAPCFDKAASFYDLNDAAVIMEKRISKLTRELLQKNLEGISKHAGKKRPALPVHEKISAIYGTELKDDETGVDDYDYEFTAVFLDASGKKLRTSSQRGGLNKSKEGNETSEETRKTVVTVSDLVDDDATETITSRSTSVSSKRSGVKRGKQQSVKATKARKKKKLPKRKNRKITKDSSEEDEEDVYTSSESEGSNWSDEASVVPKITEAETDPSNEEQDVGVSENNSAAEDSDNTPSIKSQSGRPKYDCKICLEVYPNTQAYDSHFRRHTIKEGEGFQCLCCREAFGKKQDFLDHLKLHQEGKYPCPVCHVMCNTETKIIQHLQTGHKNYWNRVPQIITS